MWGAVTVSRGLLLTLGKTQDPKSRLNPRENLPDNVPTLHAATPPAANILLLANPGIKVMCRQGVWLPWIPQHYIFPVDCPLGQVHKKFPLLSGFA